MFANWRFSFAATALSRSGGSKGIEMDTNDAWVRERKCEVLVLLVPDDENDENDDDDDDDDDDDRFV